MNSRSIRWLAKNKEVVPHDWPYPYDDVIIGKWVKVKDREAKGSGGVTPTRMHAFHGHGRLVECSDSCL
jgi:hypothetical protein